MKFDMHCHTKEGSMDGKVMIEEYICALKKKGFGGMLVSDHNSYDGYREWKKSIKGKAHQDFIVLKGLWPHHLAGEGHFAAVLERDGDGPAMPMAPPAAAQMPQELRAFCDAAGTPLPAGRLLSFGGRLWMAPPALPDVSGLKVLRAGLELGEVRKGRFIPAHAWAMWLHDAGSTADYPADSAEIASYLAGEAIPGSQTGWTLLKVDGLSLGWVKGSGGILKNHRPKGLRRMVKRENL